MANQSGFLARMQAEKNAIMSVTEGVTRQFDVDTLQIALNRDGLGYDKIMRITLLWEEVRKEYNKALRPKDPEADVAQEHMDREMVRIIRGKQELLPFSARYPDLKKVKY